MMPASLSDEKLAEAKSLLDNGATISEIHRSTGISQPTLRKYFGKSDPKPGGRKRVTPKRLAPTDEQLAALFAKAAVAPAIPMGLWVGCDFCATHFVTTGPDAARKLVEMSHDQPALRSLMEGVWRNWQEVAWASLLVTWAGVPIAHHLSPPSVYRWLQLPMGLPPRKAAAPPHAHGPAPVNGDIPPDPASPPVTPFDGLDMESLMAMAKSFGIEFDPSVLVQQPDIVVTDAYTAPQPADYTEPADAPDAAEPATVEAVAPGSDSGE